MGKAKILIVEDETITGLFIQESLENLGYEVAEIATTGHEAIDMAEEFWPDLVLMDITLNEKMDGIEAAEIIYRRFNIPVVYLTANSDIETLEKAKLTGPFGYLLKPIEEKNLLPSIEMALSKHSSENTLKSTNKWLSTVVKNMGDAIFATDNHGLLRFINDEAQKVSGFTLDEVTDKHLTEVIKLTDNNIEQDLTNTINNLFLNKNSENVFSKGVFTAKDNISFPVEYSISPIKDEFDNILGVILTLSKLNKYQKKDEILSTDELLERIRQLDNLIAICSFCKKIRDEHGQWAQLETFIQKHFNVLFTHGVCTECTSKYYPDLIS